MCGEGGVEMGWGVGEIGEMVRPTVVSWKLPEKRNKTGKGTHAILLKFEGHPRQFQFHCSSLPTIPASEHIHAPAVQPLRVCVNKNNNTVNGD